MGRINERFARAIRNVFPTANKTNSSKNRFILGDHYSSNRAIEQSGSTLRARAETAYNSYGPVRNAIRILANSMSGINVKAKGDKEIVRRFNEWAFNPENFSHCGNYDLNSSQFTILHEVIKYGEAFVLKKFERKKPKLQFITSKQVPYDNFTGFSRRDSNDRTILANIEIDKFGRPLAIHMSQSVYDYEYNNSVQISTARILKKNVCHIFKHEAMGQLRGVSWLTPIISTAADSEEYKDSELKRKKLQSAITAFIKRDVLTQDGRDDEDLEKDDLPKSVNPGSVYNLPDGTEVTFPDLKDSGDFASFTKLIIREICSGMGAPYEQVFSDMGDVNYSSARMSALLLRDYAFKIQNSMMIPKYINKILKWWVDYDSLMHSYNPNDKEKINFDIILQKQEYLDPEKEVAADIERARHGLASLSGTLRMRGYDFEEVTDQIKKDIEILKKKGLYDVISSLYGTEKMANGNKTMNDKKPIKKEEL